MTTLEKFLLVVAVFLIGDTAFIGWRWRRAEVRAEGLALKADTLRAHADTSHALALSRGDSVKLLGDSLAGAQRLVIQTAQKSDALDKALKLTRVALDQLTAQVKALSVRVASTGDVRTDTATGMRSAHFDVDQTPYKGTADVSLPRSGPGALDLKLTLSPAPIVLRLGCGAATDGVRSATATATGPAWLALSMGRVEQDPELCNPAPARDNRSAFRRLIDRCGLDIGYGVVGSGGKAYVGVAGIAGCRVWP